MPIRKWTKGKLGEVKAPEPQEPVEDEKEREGDKGGEKPEAKGGH